MSGRGITNHSVKRTMYEGSSKGMEKEAALQIWGRSRLRRTTCTIQACSRMEILWPTRQCVMLTFTLSGNWNV